MTSGYAVDRIYAKYPYLQPDEIRSRLWYSTYVSLDKKYLYFEVPKAASTSLKTLIHTVEDLPPIAPFSGSLREVRRDMFIHSREHFGMPALVDLSDAMQEHVLTSPDFLRFTAVRNPYTRILSAWQDKIRVCAPGYQHIYLERKGTLPNHKADSIISFPEFVLFLPSQDLRICDHHWRSQVDHAFFAVMNFNLIGRVETLGHLIRQFLIHINRDEMAPPPEENSSLPTDEGYDHQLADIVYSLYSRDFAELRYSKDDFPKPSTKKDDGQAKISRSALNELTERNLIIDDLYSQVHELTNRLSANELGGPSVSPPQGLSFEDLFDEYISKIEGWRARDEARYLYELAQQVARGCIVELGAYRGRTTVTLALATAAGADLPVFAIEPHEEFTGVFGGEFGPDDRFAFMRNVSRLGLHRQIRLINLRSDSLVNQWNHPVSLLCIDGDHRYEAVSSDFRHWLPSLDPGATVVFDDAADPNSGPGRLVKELLNSGRFRLHRIVGKITGIGLAA
jgi:predicted O-methyltransferase YrrM